MTGRIDATDGTYTDHEYFYIHEDLFDIIIVINQNEVITLKTIHKDISPLINKEIRDKQSNKSNKKNDMIEPFHNLQINIQKTIVDY